MRALTLTQPWAGLVASGVKLVENRDRSIIKGSHVGEPFAIHASREIDDAVFERIYEIAPELRPELATTREMSQWHQLARVTSSVIAVAILDDIVKPAIGETFTHGVHAELARFLEETRPGQGRWFFGPVGYVLRNLHVLSAPVPCRGWQGFWTLPEDIERQVRQQLNEAA